MKFMELHILNKNNGKLLWKSVCQNLIRGSNCVLLLREFFTNENLLRLILPSACGKTCNKYWIYMSCDYEMIFCVLNITKPLRSLILLRNKYFLKMANESKPTKAPTVFWIWTFFWPSVCFFPPRFFDRIHGKYLMQTKMNRQSKKSKGNMFCISKCFWRESNRSMNEYEIIFKFKISGMNPKAHKVRCRKCGK